MNESKLDTPDTLTIAADAWMAQESLDAVPALGTITTTGNPCQATFAKRPQLHRRRSSRSRRP